MAITGLQLIPTMGLTGAAINYLVGMAIRNLGCYILARSLVRREVTTSATAPR
jgi:hypothetical protein